MVVASVLLAISACSEPSTEPVDAAFPTLSGGIADARQDALTVKDAMIDGDVLVMQVEYGGGCKDHLFALHLDGTFRESYPVQTGAMVSHNAQGDACDALVQETLTFDLTPLKRMWQRAYKRLDGEMILGVGYRGNDGPHGRTFHYQFRR